MVLLVSPLFFYLLSPPCRSRLLCGHAFRSGDAHPFGIISAVLVIVYTHRAAFLVHVSAIPLPEHLVSFPSYIHATVCYPPDLLVLPSNQRVVAIARANYNLLPNHQAVCPHSPHQSAA